MSLPHKSFLRTILSGPCWTIDMCNGLERGPLRWSHQDPIRGPEPHILFIWSTNNRSLLKPLVTRSIFSSQRHHPPLFFVLGPKLIDKFPFKLKGTQFSLKIGRPGVSKYGLVSVWVVRSQWQDRVDQLHQWPEFPLFTSSTVLLNRTNEHPYPSCYLCIFRPQKLYKPPST